MEKPYVHYHRIITLDNGYQISIIHKTDISYGEDKGLFECAIKTPDNHVVNKSVTGYLDFHEVAAYIRKAKKKHNDKINTTQD
jgi:hypothetical protein